MKPGLKRQNQRLTALYSIALDLLNHHEVEEVLDTIIVRASELLDAPIGFLDLLDGDTLVTKATTKPVLSEKGDRTPLKTAALTALSITTLQPQFVDRYRTRPNRVKAFDPYRMQAACTFPIIIEDEAVGALSLGRTKPHYPFTDEDVEVMQALAQLAALALQSANLFEEAQKKSVTDSLTGLANRRQFDAAFDQEWKRAARDKLPLALIMVDIDSFKKYNDTYGHARGDECLRQIAQILAKAGRRAGDLPARYGGEEFALILPGTDRAAAKRMAEGLRRKVEAFHIPHRTSEAIPWVTISLGVAALIPTRGSDPAKLIGLADQALYQAKRTGKNRVCANVSRAIAKR